MSGSKCLTRESILRSFCSKTPLFTLWFTLFRTHSPENQLLAVPRSHHGPWTPLMIVFLFFPYSAWLCTASCVRKSHETQLLTRESFVWVEANTWYFWHNKKCGSFCLLAEVHRLDRSLHVSAAIYAIWGASIWSKICKYLESATVELGLTTTVGHRGGSWPLDTRNSFLIRLSFSLWFSLC